MVQMVWIYHTYIRRFLPRARPGRSKERLAAQHEVLRAPFKAVYDGFITKQIDAIAAIALHYTKIERTCGESNPMVAV